MNKTRNLIITLLLVAAPLMVAAQNAVAVYQTNGQVVSYLFTEKPRVTYTADCLLMTTSAGTVQYALRSLRKIAFVEAGLASAVNGTATAAGQGLAFSFRPGLIGVSGADPGARATLCNLDGRTVATQTADAQGRCTLSTEALPKGVYIVQIGKTAYKFVK